MVQLLPNKIRTGLVGALLVALAAALGSAPQAAGAASGDRTCDAGEVCLYDWHGFTHWLADSNRSSSAYPAAYDNMTSSVKNKSAVWAVVLFSGADVTGDSRYVGPGTNATFSNESFDNRASSQRRFVVIRPTVDQAKAVGQYLASTRGWGTGSQWSCLVTLWDHESGWRYDADNPKSSAYGIPQALPGSKMVTVAADWPTNARTQIVWGLDYITGRYGMPCGALDHWNAVGWY